MLLKYWFKFLPGIQKVKGKCLGKNPYAEVGGQMKAIQFVQEGHRGNGRGHRPGII